MAHERGEATDYFGRLTKADWDGLEQYLDGTDADAAAARWLASGSEGPLMMYVYEESHERPELYSENTAERLDRAARLAAGELGPTAALVETLMDRYVDPFGMGDGDKRLWALCAGLGGEEDLYAPVLAALPAGARVEDPGPAWGDRDQAVQALALMVRVMPAAAFPGGGSREERDELIRDLLEDL